MKPVHLFFLIVVLLNSFSLTAQKEERHDIVLLDNVNVGRVDKNLELNRLADKV